MKNLIVKISSLFVLAIILMVVSVQAQSITSYRAQIPFDFKIGNKTYKTGNYIISVKSPFTLGATILAVRNAKTRDLQQMAVFLTNGSRSLMDKTVLIFDRYGDQYILTKMVSSDFGISAPKSKIKNRVVKKLGQPKQTVAIFLTKRDNNIE